jgi:F0F1-type ATP synthase membrane subunit b/b'
MNLQKTKEDLERQLKQAEADYHRVAGALALVTELIKGQEAEQEKNSETIDS